MEQQTASRNIHRIADLTELSLSGAKVDCRPSFQIVPVDFQQKKHPYRAHVFMCRFEGTVDGEAYSFRKCYARGCSHNLCPHVSQAVMIANRYLVKDLKKLQVAGISVETRLFSLSDMIVKFDDLEGVTTSVMTLDDYLNLAREGHPVSASATLELIPAVEHFGNYQQSQTFLSGDFEVTSLGQTARYQRCFACFPTEDDSQRDRQMQVANTRLSALYEEMAQAGIRMERVLFA
ncbi:MAG: hypothetical protein ACOWWM_04275 [Desulfobacterales bacterium]